MMTQADIIGRNQDSYLDSGSARINKPTGFDEQFPEGQVTSLSEQSPIRPSKYFATDSAINTSKGLRKIITGGLVFSLIITLALFIQIIIGGSQVPNRIGIVTQENVCSEIGAQMVRMGGNSVDAYIASLLCLSVVNPFAAGLGAGGFLVIRDHKHDQNYAINCFFRSSASVTPPANNPVVGISSISTPGELKCLQHAYHKYARFYWKTLTAPSIDLALNGFKMSSSLAKYVQLLDITDIKNDPQLAAMFLDSNGTLKREGDLVKNPELARTLSLLNRQEYLLYHSDGSVGRELVKELAENNNGKEQITEGDLTSYLAVENELEKFRFNDFMLFTSGYPSSGPSIRFIMELIKELNINLDYLKTADFYNRLLEASKLGYILASDASDPSFAPDQKLTFDNKLTAAKTYIKNLNSSEYPFEKTNVQIKDDFYVNFISVNDHNDYMVSYVGTLGSVWGSKFISKNGFFLNNGLSLFSYNSEDKYNTPDVNKQPRGLMAPILTYNLKNPCIRRFAISYGHKGEEMNDDLAFSELAQVITKILTDFSLYETALTDKRAQFGPRSSESQVCFEDGFDSTVSSQVLSQGKFKASNSCMFHSIDLIMKKDHVVYGQADLKRSTDSLVVFN